MSSPESNLSPPQSMKVEKGIEEMSITQTIEVKVEEPELRASESGSPTTFLDDSSRSSPTKPTSLTNSPDMSIQADMAPTQEKVVGGDITIKMEPGQPPKLARSSTQKVTARAPQLFGHLPDKTMEATGQFQVITDCIYTNKYLGSTEHAMECDCSEEWDAAAGVNHACGEDSDCINRATKMECFGDCGCGSDCLNQRFQRRQYANVTVIQTEKKGYGLRTESDLQPNDFIFEYVGEVIHEGLFRRRTHQYDEEGIKHFYFMSLSKGEFVDATKKGNLGRFCNHSCNPNCYVDKWVVGDKLRMGIFAERTIRAGEELVFNYNVDRYGAEPQPCYCGEPNCNGFIGGKTQTERATKLSNATIEALGIDDGDGWDIAVAKKPRKKKTGEDDEEYVNNVQPKSLEEDGVRKVMSTLLQCKEKWIAVKLLSRIQRANEERVINCVVKLHGYQILKAALSTWKEDFNIVLQILDILNKFPRLTRNKISDSKIEPEVANLEACGDARVEAQAKALLQEWSTLETAYRIPRKKRDPNAMAEPAAQFDRRGSERKRRSRSRSPTRSRSPSLDAPRGPSAPTGPRNSFQQRYHGNRGFRPVRNFNALPAGWSAAQSNGRTYYYTAWGHTTWTKPAAPAVQPPPPPPPPKPVSANKALDDIINEITSQKSKGASEKVTPAVTPKPTEGTKLDKGEGKGKWRSLPEEKQKKLYENTLHPHVKHVVDKYKHKLPRDDLKRFFKEICKKLVSSDYQNKRVEDPTKITEKQAKKVKEYTKTFFDKAVAKKKDHDVKKAEKKARGQASANVSTTKDLPIKNEESDYDDNLGLSDNDEPSKENGSTTPVTPFDHQLKRKRSSEFADAAFDANYREASPSKRARSTTSPPPPATPLDPTLKRKRSYEPEADASGVDDAKATPNKRARSMTPPPPPPPPAEDMPTDSPGGDGVEARTLRSPYINEVFENNADDGNGSESHGSGERLNASADPKLVASSSEPLERLENVAKDGVFAPKELPKLEDDILSDGSETGLGKISSNRSRYAVAQSS